MSNDAERFQVITMLGEKLGESLPHKLFFSKKPKQEFDFDRKTMGRAEHFDHLLLMRIAS